MGPDGAPRPDMTIMSICRLPSMWRGPGCGSSPGGCHPHKAASGYVRPALAVLASCTCMVPLLLASLVCFSMVTPAVHQLPLSWHRQPADHQTADTAAATVGRRRPCFFRRISPAEAGRAAPDVQACSTAAAGAGPRAAATSTPVADRAALACAAWRQRSEHGPSKAGRWPGRPQDQRFHQPAVQGMLGSATLPAD